MTGHCNDCGGVDRGGFLDHRDDCPQASTYVVWGDDGRELASAFDPAAAWAAAQEQVRDGEDAVDITTRGGILYGQARRTGTGVMLVPSDPFSLDPPRAAVIVTPEQGSLRRVRGAMADEFGRLADERDGGD